MRILVTGAAGFVGSNLAAALLKEGHAVVGLDDFSKGRFSNVGGADLDFVAADIGRPEEWRSQVGEADVVFHQAAITDTTVTDQKEMMRVNVDAFRSLLDWSAQARVKTVVYASSAGVYGDGPVPMKESAAPRPMNVYAFSKQVMEKVAADFSAAHPKLRVVGLRYFNVFGPGETHKDKAASMIWQLALQMKAGKRPRIFEHGEQYRDFIYVKDVVDANLKALKAPNGVYNVCTGKKTTFNEIIGILNAVLTTKLAPDYFKNPYSFYQNETLGDPAKAASALKFRAKYSMEQAIEDYLGNQKASLTV